MSKYFDKFENRVNNVTAKFLNEQTTDMYNVRTNLKFAVKTARNKSKKFSFNELKSIWFAINTLGTAAAGELVGVQNLPVLADWVKISQAELVNDARGTPSKADMEKVGVDNRTDYLKKVYGGDAQFAYKEINLYTKTILNNLDQETQGRNLGTIDKTKDVGIGFTLQQLENALATADDAGISIVDALSQETGRKLSNADVDAAFDKVDELGGKVFAELNILTDLAEKKITNLKKEYKNHPEYATTFSEKILSSLSLSDIFKTDSLTIAYVKLREWATSGNPSWQQKLVNLIPTIDAIAPIVSGLEDKQKQFELTQAEQALVDAARQETDIRNQVRQTAKDKVARDDAASQETDIRNAIRQAAQDAVDRSKAGEEELANRNFIRAEAKRIAKEKNLAASQETAIRNAIRDEAKNVGASAIAARDQDLYGADDDKPFDPRYDADKDQDFQGPDDDKPFDPRYDADKDQDFLGDPETGPEGGTGSSRSEQSGYQEMAKRAFDRALANTKGPTKGDGALETARRAYDTAIKNTPGPTRGDYGARLEMSRRAFAAAMASTLDTGRGDGFNETARRAFDTALKTTLDTGRGSGESQIDRRFVDNVKGEMFDWIAVTPNPNRATGFVGIGDDAQSEVAFQQEVHREIVNMFDDERGADRAEYVNALVYRLTNDSDLLDPEFREKAINNLKRTYVKYKAQEDFLSSQDGNDTLYYGFDVNDLKSMDMDEKSQSSFDISGYIFYTLQLLTQVVPNAIQTHSTKQNVINANKPVRLSKESLDQQAADITTRLSQGEDASKDQIAARAAAGAEELANRDEIRDTARQTAEREQERRRTIADQLKTFKEIEANTTSNEAAFDAVVDMLDKLISDVEADVVGTSISSLENLQAVLDDEYTKQAQIISNSITGKEEFEALDERLYNVIIQKQQQFVQTIDEVNNTLKDQASGEDEDINIDYVLGIDTAKFRADIDAFSTVKNMPNDFISSATKRIEQIDSLSDKLQKRYGLYTDEFMVLYREIHELILSVWDNIDDIDYDGLVDLSEDTEELFELSQTGDRSSEDQGRVDRTYAATEENLEKIISKKALNFAKRVQGVRNDVVTKTKIDKIDIVDGELVLTPEAFDELYKNKDTVDDLIEEFEVIQDFFETLETEGPEYFTTVQDFLDTLVKFYQITDDYKKTMTGPGGRQSPDDAYKFYSQTLNKIRNPEKAGIRPRRQSPSLEYRIMNFWENRAPDGLPTADRNGNASNGARKSQHRTDIMSQTPDETRELLAKRRFWQILTDNFVDNPHQDTFIKTTRQGMRRIDTEFEKGEINALDSARKAIEYLDKLKDQFYG